MLQSQDGVEKTENPYLNLKQGLIKIKTQKEKAIDLARLVQLLEKDVGFEPVRQVTLGLRGRLTRRQGKLYFEVSESGQSFAVQKVQGNGERPPENQLLEAEADLARPKSGDRIILRQWKVPPSAAGEEGREAAVAHPAATAELVVRGMT